MLAIQFTEAIKRATSPLSPAYLAGLREQCSRLQPPDAKGFLGVVDGNRIYAVDGDWVKLNKDPDFVEGSNFPARPYVPPKTVWLDGRIDKGDWPYIVCHECAEMRLMTDRGMDYETAHGHANAAEMAWRREAGRGCRCGAGECERCQYARHRPAAGQKSLWSEDAHPRGQPENAGEFAKAGSTPQAKQDDAKPTSPPAAPAKPPAATQQAAPADPKAAAVADWKANGVRSKAFKAWFGPWDTDPANASKVVNAEGEPQETHDIPGTGSVVKGKDGKPVSVYHGTRQGGFTQFDRSKIKDPDELLYGGGFYFTEAKDVADEYAGKESFTISHAVSEADAKSKIAEKGEEWSKRYGQRKKGFRMYVRHDASNPPGFQWQVMGEGYVQTRATLSREPASDDYKAMGKVFAAESQKTANTDQDTSVWLGAMAKRCEAAVSRQGAGLDAGVVKQYLLNPKDVIPYPTDHDEKLADKLRKAVGIEKVYPQEETKSVYLNIRKPFDIDAQHDGAPFAKALAAIAADPKRVQELAAERGVSEEWQREALSRAFQIVTPGYLFKGDDIYAALSGAVLKRNTESVLRSMGHDGITHIGGKIMGTQTHRVWIAFEGSQVKSAENAGTFDPTNEDIRYSRGGLRERFAREIEAYARKKSAPGQGSMFGEHNVKDEPRDAGGKWTAGTGEHNNVAAQPASTAGQGGLFGKDEHAVAKAEAPKAAPLPKPRQLQLLSHLNDLAGQQDLFNVDKVDDDGGGEGEETKEPKSAQPYKVLFHETHEKNVGPIKQTGLTSNVSSPKWYTLTDSLPGAHEYTSGDTTHQIVEFHLSQEEFNKHIWKNPGASEHYGNQYAIKERLPAHTVKAVHVQDEKGNLTRVEHNSAAAKEAEPAPKPLPAITRTPANPREPSPAPQTKPTAQDRGADTAVVNLPLDKRGNGSLDSQIDKWKKEKATSDKQQSKTKAAQARDAKQKAKALFEQHGKAIAASTAAKSGHSEKEAMKTLDSMVKWEPEKAVKLFEKYESEQAAKQTFSRDRALVEQFTRAMRDFPNRESMAKRESVGLASRFAEAVEQYAKRVKSAAGQKSMFDAPSPATTPKSPEFEAAHPRSDDGTFAEKEGGGSSKPAEKPEPQWKYDEYNDWSRQIARTTTRAEIEKEIGKAEGARSGLAASHLRSIEKTSSMTGNSQHRAQSRASMVGNYERLQAYKNALEIYENYPEETKEGKPATPTPEPPHDSEAPAEAEAEASAATPEEAEPITGWHTVFQEQGGFSGGYGQRGPGTYVALDKPFMQGVRGGVVHTATVTSIRPEEILDPRDLIPGSNVKKSRKDWQVGMDKINAMTNEEINAAGGARKALQGVYKSMGYKAEAGEIEPGHPEHGRELVVWDRENVALVQNDPTQPSKPAEAEAEANEPEATPEEEAKYRSYADFVKQSKTVTPRSMEEWLASYRKHQEGLKARKAFAEKAAEKPSEPVEAEPYRRPRPLVERFARAFAAPTLRERFARAIADRLEYARKPAPGQSAFAWDHEHDVKRDEKGEFASKGAGAAGSPTSEPVAEGKPEAKGEEGTQPNASQAVEPDPRVPGDAPPPASTLADQFSKAMAAAPATDTKTTPDGTVYRRSPKGGAKSPVNGKHYKGGWWMPIHGKSERAPGKKGKGKGSPGGNRGWVQDPNNPGRTIMGEIPEGMRGIESLVAGSPVKSWQMHQRDGWWPRAYDDWGMRPEILKDLAERWQKGESLVPDDYVVNWDKYQSEPQNAPEEVESAPPPAGSSADNSQNAKMAEGSKPIDKPGDKPMEATAKTYTEDQWSAAFKTFSEKIDRLHEMKRQGRYGYQLSMPKAAVKKAANAMRALDNDRAETAILDSWRARQAAKDAGGDEE